MSSPLQVAFVGGSAGRWRVVRNEAVRGAGLPAAACLDVVEGPEPTRPYAPAWVLRATTSNARYTTRLEMGQLASRQAGLGRPEARCAALIPIRKTPAWWRLMQDERRALFAEGDHTGIGLDYLPGVARRLHHGRDLGEPFDFLTWFEYAPEHAGAFEEMCQKLRGTPEWRFVEREVDIRLSRP